MTYQNSYVHSHDVYPYMVTNIWVTIQACSTHGVPHVRMLLYDRVTTHTCPLLQASELCPEGT